MPLNPNPYTFDPPNNEFPIQPWTTGGDGVWAIDSSTASVGTYSIRSPNFDGEPIKQVSNATLEVCDDFEGGPLTFYAIASVLPPQDVFIVYIDGEVAAQLVDVQTFEEVKLELKPGAHRVDFSYQYNIFSLDPDSPDFENIPNKILGAVWIDRISTGNVEPGPPATTYRPTMSPVGIITNSPTSQSTNVQTSSPTSSPSSSPSIAASSSPSIVSSTSPSTSPSSAPTQSPTSSNRPTALIFPSASPTASSEPTSSMPTITPSSEPSLIPSVMETISPAPSSPPPTTTLSPSIAQSDPTDNPTLEPTTTPTVETPEPTTPAPTEEEPTTDPTVGPVSIESTP